MRASLPAIGRAYRSGDGPSLPGHVRNRRDAARGTAGAGRDRGDRGVAGPHRTGSSRRPTAKPSPGAPAAAASVPPGCRGGAGYRAAKPGCRPSHPSPRRCCPAARTGRCRRPRRRWRGTGWWTCRSCWKLSIRNSSPNPSIRLSSTRSNASGVTSRPVMPVPPVVITTSIAGSAIQPRSRCSIRSASSRSIARSTTMVPGALAPGPPACRRTYRWRPCACPRR